MKFYSINIEIGWTLTTLALCLLKQYNCLDISWIAVTAPLWLPTLLGIHSVCCEDME